jgi:hypothetical protein
MTAWEKAGIIAAVLIGALDALIATTRAARTAREPDTLKLADLTAVVGQPLGGDHEYQLAHAEGWLPARRIEPVEWTR